MSKQRRNGDNAAKKAIKKQKKDPNLLLHPAFAGQQVKQFRIEATPQLFSTTITTGVIALDVGISNVLISNFATRFGATWEEFRIISAQCDVRLFSSTNPGLLIGWFDEKNIGVAPTLAESRTKSVPKMGFNASSVDTLHKFRWTAHDITDLVYTATNANKFPVDFKIYSDLANYGSSAVATAYGEVFTTLVVQFRGFL